MNGVMDQDRAKIIAEVIEAALGGEHHDLASGIAAQLVELMPDRPSGLTLASAAEAVQKYINLDADALKARRSYTEYQRANWHRADQRHVTKQLHDMYEAWQRAEDARNNYMTLLGVS